AAPGVFLYAARRASSSAATSAPSSIPLSRSISRTASMISWLMSHPLVDQVRPDDVVVRDLGLVDLDGARVGGDELAAEAALPRPELDAVADGVREVLRLSQRPVRTGGGDVDGVLAEVVAQDVGDPRAERVVDAGRTVDVHREVIRAVQLDSEHLDAFEGALDACADLALQLLFLLPYVRHASLLSKKMGPQGPFRRTGENGVRSVASPGFWSTAGCPHASSRGRRSEHGREGWEHPADRVRRGDGRARAARPRRARRRGGCQSRRRAPPAR